MAPSELAPKDGLMVLKFSASSANGKAPELIWFARVMACSRAASSLLPSKICTCPSVMADCTCG